MLTRLERLLARSSHRAKDLLGIYRQLTPRRKGTQTKQNNGAFRLLFEDGAADKMDFALRFMGELERHGMKDHARKFAEAHNVAQEYKQWSGLVKELMTVRPDWRARGYLGWRPYGFCLDVNNHGENTYYSGFVTPLEKGYEVEVQLHGLSLKNFGLADPLGPMTFTSAARIAHVPLGFTVIDLYRAEAYGELQLEKLERALDLAEYVD